jgi:hypothetical protein
MTLRFVLHESPEYRQAVDLRLRVLRRPIGLDLSEEQLAREDFEFHLVAIERDQVIGCLVLTPLTEGQIKMRQVAVAPETQGNGIGSQMVAESERLAREKGFGQMVLNARETAVAFYLHLDYELVGEPFIEVGIPHRKMAKRL